MLGFTPLAAAPIADDAGSYITLVGVTTGAPVVSNVTVQAKYSFAPDGITTGATTVASLSAQISYSFAISNVITGAPGLAGRWQWVVQPDDTQNWIDVSSVSDTWTDVPEVTDVWSSAA